MELKVLINAILIILVLHLLIKNFSYKKVIHLFSFNSKKIKETFSNSLQKYANEHKKTMEFLLDTPTIAPVTNTVNESAYYNILVNYVNKCQDSVKPGNYYVEDENSANFMSNVLNTHKFYNRDTSVPGSYDGLTNQQLENVREKKDPAFLAKVEDQTCFPKRNLHDNYGIYPNDNTEPIKPDNWNYKHELPMNGGSVVGNVVGFDSLNSGYATYTDGQSVVNPSCKNKMDCNVEQDDIRFGLGYPNKEYRETR